MGCVAQKKKEVKVVSSNDSVNLSTALSVKKLKESNQTNKRSKNIVLQIVPKNQLKCFSILKRTPVILDQQIIQFCYEEVCNKKKHINDIENTSDERDVLQILCKSFQEMNFRINWPKLHFVFLETKILFIINFQNVLQKNNNSQIIKFIYFVKQINYCLFLKVIVVVLKYVLIILNIILSFFNLYQFIN